MLDEFRRVNFYIKKIVLFNFLLLLNEFESLSGSTLNKIYFYINYNMQNRKQL